MTKLEDTYSWEEIADLFIRRMKEHDFIGRFNEKDFKKWFMAREKLGLRFDWRMVARCYCIWKDLQDEKDHFIVIVGKEGSGKSTFMIQLCSWISPKMDMLDVCFVAETYIDRLSKIALEYKKKTLDQDDKSLCIDEGGISLFGREAMSESNRTLTKTFMVQRFLNVNVAICIPHYPSLDSMVREHRIKTLINISKRGEYKCFVGKGVEAINKGIKKDRSTNLNAIAVPYGYFWDGGFRKDFTNNIKRADYENHKLKHINKFLKDIKKSGEVEGFVKVGKMAKELGLTSETIKNMIKDKKMEGQKLGGSWLVSKKTYLEALGRQNA